MCKGLASNAKIFKDLKECILFLQKESFEQNEFEWNSCSKQLLKELQGEVKP